MKYCKECNEPCPDGRELCWECEHDLKLGAMKPTEGCESCRIILEEHVPQPVSPIYAPAEKLVCSRCGKVYVSRGKYDPGICYDCAEIGHLKPGGPL